MILREINMTENYRESRENPPITMICMKCKNMARHIPKPDGNICEVCGSGLVPLDEYKKTSQYMIDELCAAVIKFLHVLKEDLTTQPGMSFWIFMLIMLGVIFIFVK
jgi:hypothetical protein